jgi:hypothetical protein
MLKSLIAGLLALFAATFGLQHGGTVSSRALQQHPAQAAAVAAATEQMLATTTPQLQALSSMKCHILNK